MGINISISSRISQEEARQYLRKMRTRDTLMMAFFDFQKREQVKAWYFMRQGTWYDWFWPLKFGLQVFDRLIHSVLRRISSRA